MYVALSSWRATNPKTKEAIGNGAFNLVKKATFEKTAGFDWLKMEVADDIGLAQLMKKEGAKMGVAVSPELIQVPWYPTLASLFTGMEKNLFAQLAHYSLFRGLFAFLGRYSRHTGKPIDY